MTKKDIIQVSEWEYPSESNRDNGLNIFITLTADNLILPISIELLTKKFVQDVKEAFKNG